MGIIPREAAEMMSLKWLLIVSLSDLRAHPSTHVKLKTPGKFSIDFEILTFGQSHTSLLWLFQCCLGNSIQDIQQWMSSVNLKEKGLIRYEFSISSELTIGFWFSFWICDCRYERSSTSNFGRDREVRRSDPDSHRSTRDGHSRYSENSKPPGSSAPRKYKYWWLNHHFTAATIVHSACHSSNQQVICV